MHAAKGIDLPDPQGEGGGFLKVGPDETGVPDDKFMQADKKCRHLLPDIAHGGKVIAENADGGGAQFRLRLPTLRAADRP